MIDIDNMSLKELRDLSDAIIAEARKRANEALEIAGKPSRRYTVKLPSGRKGAYSDDLYRKCAEAGMTAPETARHIGCHTSHVYNARKRLGLTFAKGKRGRKRHD